ncbi:MAG: NAD(P)/FAD-dependent oxidoreductase [Salinivirgaceae bacterium]|nr:NAD(P)/FAD-dependent oxidoreductase [Salinivirgaceae bacterium]
MIDIIVIGAGAAGLLAAGTAAEKGKKVLLLEKMERSGRKLLITGKGRCNITNSSYASEHFKQIHPKGKYLKTAYSKYFASHIIELLQQFGVTTEVERGNRVFPTSNQAADVVNALDKWIRKNRVEVKYKTKVKKLLITEGAISGVELESGEIFNADKVIVATGGKSYAATGSTGDGYTFAKQAGHLIEKTYPALVPIETKGEIAQSMQGLALKNANVSLWVNGKKAQDEFGELLFTHFGLSGPVILTLSRSIVGELDKGNKVELSIDLKPALDEVKLDQRLIRDLNEFGKKQIDNIFRNWLPSKMIPVFLELLNIDSKKEGHQISAKERKGIKNLMKNLAFEVSGYRSFKEAIITAGGVNTSEVDNKTMESKLVKGLYFAGEVLDLDANTGGYNLQIAWSTGYLAAVSACE